MFYPSDSLRRGGRFYPCWIADSWPIRFANMSQKQIWSYDVRRICDDLREVVTTESGNTNKRFSLRLSSQLLRGLVRLYHRKAQLLIGDICMMNANVNKHVNRKYAIKNNGETRTKEPKQQQEEPFVPQEEIQDVPRIEELIQNRSNVVRNIEDITLKENVIQEVQPPTDGFGEENPEQTLQFLQDRTIEVMLHQVETSALTLDVRVEGDRSHERSRLVAPEARMERLSEHDITVFGRPSTAQLPPPEERDIPEIPEIPVPEVSAPQIDVQKTPENEKTAEVSDAEKRKRAEEAEEIELEEIEEQPPRPKRRRLPKLIVDKKTQLSSTYLRSRIAQTGLELRAATPFEDTVVVRLPWDEFSRRPGHAGFGIYSRLSHRLTQLYTRHLDTSVERIPFAERGIQEAMTHRQVSREHVPLATVAEEVEPLPEDRSRRMQEIAEDISRQSLNVTDKRVVSMEMDISELPTQKIVTVQQEKPVTTDDVPSPRKRRAVGVWSSRDWIANLLAKDAEANKENIPEDAHQLDKSLRTEDLTQMLEDNGLADANRVTGDEGRVSKGKRSSNNGTETPLGSLDRTKVSLGDSEPELTQSKKFLQDQWGTEGTIIKILTMVKAKHYPITVKELVENGPVIPGSERIIAAKCFSSLLRLNQYQFIRIEKIPNTLEIKHITLGAKFDNCTF